MANSLSSEDKYISFDGDIFFATIRDRFFLDEIKELYPTYVLNRKGTAFIPISSDDVVKDTSILQKFYYNLIFRRNDEQSLKVIIPLENEHSLNYFLTTLRIAPFFIENFYNKVLVDYSHIFNTYKKNGYSIYDCENLMFKHSVNSRSPISDIISFFSALNFDSNNKYIFKTYIIKNSTVFDKFLRHRISLPQEKCKRKYREFYSFDLLKDIRGARDNTIEVLLHKKNLNMADLTNLKDYEVKNINEILLSYGNVANQSPPYNFKDGSFDIMNEPLIPENLNIYVERNENSLETIIISIPSLGFPGRFVSHGLDDLLIKFLKKYYDSIVTLHIDKRKKKTFKKKMETELGINSNNKGLLYRNNINNTNFLLRTISSVQENTSGLTLNNLFGQNNSNSNNNNSTKTASAVEPASANKPVPANNNTVLQQLSTSLEDENTSPNTSLKQGSYKKTVNNISTSELDELLREFQIANTVKPKTATLRSKKGSNASNKQKSKKAKKKKKKK